MPWHVSSSQMRRHAIANGPVLWSVSPGASEGFRRARRLRASYGSTAQAQRKHARACSRVIDQKSLRADGSVHCALRKKDASHGMDGPSGHPLLRDCNGSLAGGWVSEMAVRGGGWKMYPLFGTTRPLPRLLDGKNLIDN